MAQDFTDAATARAWDADPAARNPARTEQLDLLLTIIEQEHRPGTAILDIGMGSGRVEESLFGRLPEVHVVGIDHSEAMLGLAAGRLAPWRGRYQAIRHDLTDLGSLELPSGPYPIVFSVQTLHNLADRHKVGVVARVFDALMPGGLFLLLDRIAVEPPGLFPSYRALWERLGRVHGTALAEGRTYAEHLDVLADQGDRPADLEGHLAWFRGAGFEAACLHLHANRALIVGRKSGG
ncbi:class I SAM-dependent methyltransferase [Tautonia plasticadhaerens]|uniref:Methyltransferase domain-containing protein n=1 Tax=Tautonia plasticadhaerens TaxID=2527974 RepID=A0A518H3W8_9BACT|nr:class I SAM-dependent methyltransferase [Tautonia plasticadhaerens]QDV35523.1 hypothetical protein ElP_34260 [Tautonia plasticadhaerens]